MKVLIAEDSLDSRLLLTDILESMSFEVVAVGDGSSALDAAQTERPDLILLDVNMPGMTGFDVLERLKADPELASIPVLMLTALAGIEDRVKGLGLGADDYLVKPYSPRELIARVSTRLRAKRESDELRESRERIRATFERFVAPTVVEQLLADPDQVTLGGRLQEITVMFADLEGFTTLSERLEPIEVIDVLNRYLERIVAVLKDGGGTIDKYLGDGVMALFNTPLPQADHALRAVRAALRIREGLDEFHKGFEARCRLGINFGIHTGKAIVGNVGTADLMDFTAVGDTVNTASRLQGLCHGSQVLISRATYEQVQEQVDACALGSRRVKGREEPVEIYQVTEMKL
ncbi:MAG: response regulator [Anaerolineae bacterium]|nr:response regulator [Anaerolineae bacterium]